MSHGSGSRIGARIDRALVEDALGYAPEVGEAFEAGGLALRVMARTIGVEPQADGREAWFDELFVATVDEVADAEAAGERLRRAFVGHIALDGEDEARAEAEHAERDAEAEADAATSAPAQSPIEVLDDVLRSQIEDILRRAA